LLLNGDTYFAVELKKLIDFSLLHSTDWCFSLFRAQEVDRYMGLDVGPDGHIESLKSGNLCKIGGLANGGAYWVNGKALDHFKWPDNTKTSLEDDILPFAALSGQFLFGLEFPGTFIDIGVPLSQRLCAIRSCFPLPSFLVTLSQRLAPNIELS
jgi:D-glycero-alpha-D-manno-heptose 1-phosphate guanylyltransferase